VPALRAHVLDRANLLSEAAERALELELTEFERKAGHQVVVHTTPSLEGLEIEQYSMELAEAWKVGHEGLDNGVILTVAPNERRVRIEVGYGLEGILPDAIAARIVREQIAPEFRAGRMEEGVSAGAKAILSVIRGEVLPLPQRAAPRPRGVSIGTLLLLGFLLLFVLRFGQMGGSRRRMRGRYGGWGVPIGFPTGRGGFGRGGFGGGFGGGGGGFGGGGASGSW
jgi:uncharacterized protein